jgi:phospho-N-acetylmuramoyl-pentapeptide-transferase
MLILILDLIKAHLPPDSRDIGPIRMLDYITVRTALALALAFIISLVIGPVVIRRLAGLKARQVIRKSRGAAAIDLSEMHKGKAGTPTMGGLLMILALLAPVLLFCRLTNTYIFYLLAMTLGYGALGFWDDYLKVTQQHHKGVTPGRKLLIQAGLGLILGWSLWYGQWNVVYPPTGDYGYPFLIVPFVKSIYYHMGWWFIPFVMLVMMCTSNAVNLTDGLDGLAIGVSIASVVPFMIIAYLVSRPSWAHYFYVPYVAGGGEIVVFLGALLGASLGFLWFNAHPAQVLMGDTGSMMLGGALGTTAILLKQELLLMVIGGVFVVEALSVIVQVTTFKLTGTRFFLMSPLHHHFEKRGLSETKIIIRFWLISWLLALAGLAMLKMR